MDTVDDCDDFVWHCRLTLERHVFNFADNSSNGNAKVDEILTCADTDGNCMWCAFAIHAYGAFIKIMNASQRAAHAVAISVSTG